MTVSNYQQHTSLAIILTDAQRYILWVNTGFCRITGYSLEEVVGRKPSILQGKGTPVDVIQRLRRKLAEGMPFKDEILNYRKDGTPYPCRLVIHPIYDVKGELTNFLAFEVDADQTDDEDIPEMQLDATTLPEILPFAANAQSPEQALYKTLLQLFDREKTFLDPDLTLNHLAEALQTNRTYLSKIINKYANKRYTDFVNSYRIQEWMKRRKEDTLGAYTLGALALECGFKQETSFYRAFKRMYGQSPRLYVHENN